MVIAGPARGIAGLFLPPVVLGSPAIIFSAVTLRQNGSEKAKWDIGLNCGRQLDRGRDAHGRGGQQRQLLPAHRLTDPFQRPRIPPLFHGVAVESGKESETAAA